MSSRPRRSEHQVDEVFQVPHEEHDVEAVAIQFEQVARIAMEGESAPSLARKRTAGCGAR